MNIIMKVVSPDWYFIDGKWIHCMWVKRENKAIHYVDGKFNHEISLTNISTVLMVYIQTLF